MLLFLFTIHRFYKNHLIRILHCYYSCTIIFFLIDFQIDYKEEYFSRKIVEKALNNQVSKEQNGYVIFITIGIFLILIENLLQ